MHIYVDETKEKAFLMAAAVVLPGDVSNLARLARTHLRYRNAPRLHMKNENKGHKVKVLNYLESWGIEAVIFDASAHRSQVDARAKALRAIAAMAQRRNAAHLIIETDSTMVRRDEDVLKQWKKHRGWQGNFRHMSPTQEPILWIADALAWSYAAGGQWRVLAMRCITDVVKVS